MTSLQSLTIKGIRSYSPRDHQQIIFQKPLTIILGSNGSGKTTIIECLRFATTGEYPPGSSSGSSFVHDASLSGGSEVRGQIKLEFITTSRKREMISRLLLGTVNKKGKCSVKQLEAAFSNHDQNSSSKVGDANVEMVKLMGVSKAVLNSVIFCHQEDVNWPLGPPSELKKQFDDIFASSRYSDALKVLSDMKKKLDLDVKQLEADLTVSKKNKDQAEEYINAVRIHQENMREIEQNIESSQNDLDRTDLEISKIATTIEKINSIQEKLKLKKRDYNNLKSTVDELLHKIMETFTESPEELNRMLNGIGDKLQQHLDDFDENMRKADNSITEKTHTLKKLNESIQNMERDLRDTLTNKLALEMEKKESEDRLTALVNDISRIEGQNIDNIPSWDIINNFLQRLQLEYDNATQSLEEFTSRNSKTLNSLTEKKNHILQKTSTCKNSMLDLRNTENQLHATIKQLEKFISESTINEDAIYQCQKLLSDKKKQRDAMREQQESLDFDKRITNLKSEILSKKNIRGELKQAIEIRSKEEDIKKKIHELKDEIFLLEKQIHCKSLEESIFNFCGSQDIYTSNISDVIQSNLKSLRDEIKMQMILKEENRDKISAINNTICMEEQIIKDLKQKQMEIIDLLKEYSGSIESLDILIDDTEKEYNDAYSDLQVDIANQQIANEVKRHAQRFHKCPTCERGLHESEIESFIQKQDSRLKDTNTKSNRIQELKKKLECLRSLKPNNDELVKLPVHEQKLHDYKVNLEILVSNQEMINSKLISIENQEKNGVDILNQYTMQVLNPSKELHKKKCLLQENEVNLQKLGTGKNVKDLKEQEKELKNEIQLLKSTLDSLSSEKDAFYHKVLSLDDECQKAEKLYQEYERTYNELQGKRSELSNATEKVKQVQEKLSQAENELLPLEKELYEANEKFMKEGKRIALEETTFKKKILDLEKQKMEFSSRKNEILRFDNIKKSKLSELILKERNIQSEINGKKQEIESISKEIEEEKENLLENTKNRRLLEDCMTYQRKNQDLKNMDSYLLKKESKLSRFDKLENLNSSIKILDKEKQELSRNIHKGHGSLITLQEECKKLEKKLEEPQIALSGRHYNDTLIKLETTRAACDDIVQYRKSLENVLLNYHRRKMDEINHIIKNLWQKTYRGHDIDYVAIRASSDSTKKGYNYRMVMRKGDVELDMRGRCSAGQKVLASLIVRLALAEAFCVECGIMTLDEPTVSLDKENIHSLAEALQILMQERRGKNIQLVIITHDEDFVQRMGRSEFVESFYRVSKNSDGYSVVREEMFNG